MVITFQLFCIFFPAQGDDWTDICNTTGVADHRQSPVDILFGTEQAIITRPLAFSADYFTKGAAALGRWTHNGTTIYFTPYEKNFCISGGPLNCYTYCLSSIHFHWGTGAAGVEGSEHAFDGTKHDLEVHMVHINTDSEYATGDLAAVLGYFFDSAASKDTPSKVKAFFNAIDNAVDVSCVCHIYY